MSLNGEGSDQDICRDFLRNACTRGSGCKFKHPAPTDLKKYATDVGLPFCHDYQNRGCERPNCRYMHISREEEKQIKETGIIPQHLISETSKNILHASDVGVMPGETPLCKDYQKGTCNRGMMCKFRHVDLTQDYSAAVAAAAATGYAQYGTTAETQYYEGAVAPPQKRQMYDADYYNRIGGTATASYYRPTTTTDYYSSYYRLPGATAAATTATTAPVAATATTTSLADENKALKEEVERMKLQLAELRAANDLLLEQNARLRVTKEQAGASTGSAALTSVAPVAEQTPVATQDPNPESSSASGDCSGTEVGGSNQAVTDSSTAQTGAVAGGSSEIPYIGSQSTSDAATESEQTSEAPVSSLASDSASCIASSGTLGNASNGDTNESVAGESALSSAYNEATA